MKEKKVIVRKSKTEIDVDNFNQIRNAAMSMGVAEAKLKEAIEKVGPGNDAVRLHLKVFKNPYFHRVASGRRHL